MLLEKNENRKNMKVCKKMKNFSSNNEKRVHKENNGNQNLTKNFKIQKIDLTKDLTPAKILFVAETNKIKTGNLKNILSNELMKSSDNYRSDFLEKHTISEEIRARMVK
jgi:hypothetical protein